MEFFKGFLAVAFLVGLFLGVRYLLKKDKDRDTHGSSGGGGSGPKPL